MSTSDAMNINEVTINSIADKVLEKLQLNLPHVSSDSSDPTGRDQNTNTEVKYTDNYRQTSYRVRNNRGRRGQYRAFSRTPDNQPRKCRSCQSTEHLIRNNLVHPYILGQ